VAKITTYTRVWNQEVQANLITAVTDEAFKDGRRNWGKMGFLSRFIIFSYSYGSSTVSQILESYSEHGVQFQSLKVKVPKRPVDVALSKAWADRLDPIARQIGRQFYLYGFRAKLNFRCLLKCLAYRNKRKTVTEGELYELVDLVHYMNWDCHLL
jgi:hypothetical protein